ncbi:phospholipase C/P1 nuclease domain-containing protein [Amylocystis lapponica]|nr:phospholipase C/P1 nuclease domain-containing protein [Amylocystis lapponica]
MRIISLSGAVAGVLVANIPTALAWGAAGHEIIATIAQIYLDPSVLPVLCNILNSSSEPTPSAGEPPCYLAPIAAWADNVRRQPAYRYTAQLHYIGALDDSPSASCAFPGPRGWAAARDHNVLAAVGNSTHGLQQFLAGESSAAQGAEALKFLVHFVGDMHMPLHLTGRERGGNGARVLFDRRITNLHTVWDSRLIAQGLRTVSRNYTRALPGAQGVEAHLRGAIYDPYVRRIMHEGFAEGRFAAFHDWLACPAVEAQPSLFARAQALLGLGGDERRWDDGVLCPYAWAGDIHALNCELPVWPHELDARAPSGAHAGFEETHVEHAHHGLDEDEVVVDGGPLPHPGVLELDTPEYAGRIREEWIVERLLAMAGIRLAGILNGLILGAEGTVLRVGAT